jgi:hypothetical protein
MEPERKASGRYQEGYVNGCRKTRDDLMLEIDGLSAHVAIMWHAYQTDNRPVRVRTNCPNRPLTEGEGHQRLGPSCLAAL